MRKSRLTVEKLAVCVLVLAGALLLMGASAGCETQTPTPVSFPSKVVWTPDGKHIIFSRGFQGILMVDVAGSELRAIPEDAPMGTASSPGYALPALSPDGTRLAYVAQLGGLAQSTAIMVFALNGSGARRLTHDAKTNTHPAWSPDGEEIAYVADGKLAVMRADGTNSRVLAQSVELVYAAPVWSPDGSRIAFVGELQDSAQRAVYTVRLDGTGLTQLGPTVSVPSWSPDGSRISFFMPEDDEKVGLYTLESNGADLQRVWPLDKPEIWVDNLTWSPDGSAILFASAAGEVVIVTLDISKEKGPFRYSAQIGPFRYGKLAAPHATSFQPREYPGHKLARGVGTWAAWSPDGEGVAVIAGHNSNSDAPHQDLLYTMSRVEALKRVLVLSKEQRLVANHADWYKVSRNVAACAEGYVVSDPAAEGLVVSRPYANPGLAEDCETLMTVRERLAGDFLLNWSRETPITEWWGVELAQYNSSRVGSLILRGTGGEIGWVPNFTYASMHAGRVASLQGYDIGNRGLTGSIPPELGKLTGLRSLSLGNNELYGGIPPELGKLVNLSFLELANSGLSGNIPPELGDLTNLGMLHLYANSLNGNIPPELGNLSSLTLLLLNDNNLKGNIPPELGNLTGLLRLDLQDNALTGCVPAAFSSSSTWVKTDGLGLCKQ